MQTGVVAPTTVGEYEDGKMLFGCISENRRSASFSRVWHQGLNERFQDEASKEHSSSSLPGLILYNDIDEFQELIAKSDLLPNSVQV